MMMIFVSLRFGLYVSYSTAFSLSLSSIHAAVPSLVQRKESSILSTYSCSFHRLLCFRAGTVISISSALLFSLSTTIYNVWSSVFDNVDIYVPQNFDIFLVYHRLSCVAR